MAEDSAQLAGHMEAVARLLLGDPNRAHSRGKTLAFGSHGSMKVDLAKGTWFSHETEAGGGVLDLIEREMGLKGAEAVGWMREQGIPVEVRQPAERSRAGGREAIDPANPFSWRQTAHFDYRDEAGQLVYQVVRLESGRVGKDGKPEKTFRQRRPDPAARDGWTWKVAGLKPLPYRLGELKQAIAEGQIVFIAEGEKCVEALRERGIVATCNSGGAGKFAPELVEHFKGAEVCILPDNDDAGRKHRDLVMGSLAKVAAKVSVLDLPDLPPKGDVVDWFAKGGTADDLYELVHGQAVPSGQVAFRSAFHAIPWRDLDRPGPEHEWLIKGVLTRKERSMLVGPSQSGKSFLGVALAMAVARGVDFFGLRTRQGGVVYQAGEGGKGLKKRLRAYRDQHGLSLDRDLPFVLLPASLDLYASEDQTNAFIAEVRHWSSTFEVPLELVVIDTLSAATPGANENASEDMSRVLARCARIAESCDCAVMLVHHMNKDGGKPRGHSSIFANLDNVLQVEKTEQRDLAQRPIRTAMITKQKDGEDGARIQFVLRSIEVGRDADDEPITSCICEPPSLGEQDAQQGAAGFAFRGANARLIFSALYRALERHGIAAPAGTTQRPNARVVDRSHWREEFERIAPFDDTDSPERRAERVRKALQRAMTDFQNWRLIEAADPHVWLTGRLVRGFDIGAMSSVPLGHHPAEPADPDDNSFL